MTVVSEPRFAIASVMLASVAASKALVASSKTINRGLLYKARASPRRWI